MMVLVVNGIPTAFELEAPVHVDHARALHSFRKRLLPVIVTNRVTNTWGLLFKGLQPAAQMAIV